MIRALKFHFLTIPKAISIAAKLVRPSIHWKVVCLSSLTFERYIEETATHPPDAVISFRNPFIIPSRILDVVRAYNVHPAIVEYPGQDPQHWAAYDGVMVPGATLHLMTTKVDAGPILASVCGAPRDTVTEVIQASEVLTENLLIDNLDAIVSDDLSPNGDEWGPAKHTRADFISMCDLTDVDDEEAERRVHAFHHSDYVNKLYVRRGKHRFALDAVG